MQMRLNRLICNCTNLTTWFALLPRLLDFRTGSPACWFDGLRRVCVTPLVSVNSWIERCVLGFPFPTQRRSPVLRGYRIHFVTVGKYMSCKQCTRSATIHQRFFFQGMAELVELWDHGSECGAVFRQFNSWNCRSRHSNDYITGIPGFASKSFQWSIFVWRRPIDIRQVDFNLWRPVAQGSYYMLNGGRGG